ncbi:MAG: hypothetical protein WA840_23920 [Caulobacteraceae bacterium]
MTTVIDRFDAPAEQEEGRLGARSILWSGRYGAAAVATLQALLVLAIWLLSRSYDGIVHDSRIYIGRIAADLDPMGLGREALFSLDGQTKFTVYSWLAEPLVRLLRPALAAMVLTLATLMTWLAAATWMADRLMTRRLVMAGLICASMLPAVYGPFDIFSFGEAFTTPRGMAEVAVLAALAAMLDKRRSLSAGLLLFASLMHVPTALAGLGVAFLIGAFEMPGLWLLAPVGCGAVIVGGCLHLGPLKTLFQAYDPAWLAVMHLRNPFLFVSQWPQQAWSQAVVPLTTLVIATHLTQGHVRLVLAGTAVLGVLGVAAAYLLGDLTSSILILQLQLWRSLWLVKVLATLVVPLCAVRLWDRERTDARFVLALLTCAWCGIDSLPLTLPLCIAALVVLVLDRQNGPDRTSSLLVLAASAFAVLLVVGSAVVGVLATAKVLSGSVVSLSVCIRLFLALGLYRIPLAVAAVAFSIRPLPVRPGIRLPALAAALGVVLPLAFLGWSQNLLKAHGKDVSDATVALKRLIGPAQKGVIWIGDDIAPWFLAGSPTWVNSLQGTAGAFSRPLAMQWDARSKQLVAAGLGTHLDRDPNVEDVNVAKPTPRMISRGALRLCPSNDGPAAIVAPGDLTRLFAPGQTTLWRSPYASQSHQKVSAGQMGSVHSGQYTVIRCIRDLRLASAR